MVARPGLLWFNACVSQPQRNLIFGGTFDPIHTGHLIVARAVAEAFDVPKVTLMPTRTPPHKAESSAPAEHRLAMCRLAVGDDPLFEVSELELDREGPSYTVDTLRQIKQQQPDAEILWMIGLDMLRILHQWREAEAVVNLARIVTALRPPRPGNLAKELRPLENAFGRERFGQLLADVVETPLIEVSSTEIRRRLAAGRPIRYLTPVMVADYISKSRLYNTRDNAGEEQSDK